MPEAHALAVHLADYVLVWVSEDLGKSSHMARIGNSAFRGHCYDSSCEQYGSHQDGTPSAMQKESLIWHLLGNDGPHGSLPKPLFQEVVAAPPLPTSQNVIQCMHVFTYCMTRSSSRAGRE